MQPFSRFARYFVAVARSGSVRRAADAIHISASAIDRHIVSAEQECGTLLFERSSQGLRLTAAGELVLADMERWQRDHDRTLEMIAELAGLRRGHVTIALVEALTEGFLPRVLERVRFLYPNLTFDLRVMRNSQIADQLLERQADIGLLLDPDSHREIDCKASFGYPLGLVTCAGHSLAGRQDLGPADLGDQPLIVAADTFRVSGLSRDFMGRVSKVGRRTTCNDIRLIRSLVALDQGVAILSQHDVACDIESGLLEFTPIDERHLSPLRLGIAVAPGRQLSTAAEFVLSALTASLLEQGPVETHLDRSIDSCPEVQRTMQPPSQRPARLLS